MKPFEITQQPFVNVIYIFVIVMTYNSLKGVGQVEIQILDFLHGATGVAKVCRDGVRKVLKVLSVIFKFRETLNRAVRK